MSQVTITEILDKLKSGELESPNELANYLVQLSASLFSAGNYETEARMAFAVKWLELKKQVLPNGKEKTDKMVDMEAQTTEEYRLFKKMEVANKAMLETIRSLKKKLKSLEIESSL